MLKTFSELDGWHGSRNLEDGPLPLRDAELLVVEVVPPVVVGELLPPRRERRALGGPARPQRPGCASVHEMLRKEVIQPGRVE